jgi:hypothetical protein
MNPRTYEILGGLRLATTSKYNVKLQQRFRRMLIFLYFRHLEERGLDKGKSVSAVVNLTVLRASSVVYASSGLENFMCLVHLENDKLLVVHTLIHVNRVTYRWTQTRSSKGMQVLPRSQYVFEVTKLNLMALRFLMDVVTCKINDDCLCRRAIWITGSWP